MALLGVKDRYLKRLRDNDLLGYSRHGDKYWYTQADVDHFLSQCHCAPFNTESLLELTNRNLLCFSNQDLFIQ